MKRLGQIGRLGIPLGLVGVSVSRIQDGGVDARQLGRHFQVEHRQYLGRRLLDGTIQDGVDDATGIL